MQPDETQPQGRTMRGPAPKPEAPLTPSYPEHKVESHPSPDLDALWESIRKIAEGT